MEMRQKGWIWNTYMSYMAKVGVYKMYTSIARIHCSVVSKLSLSSGDYVFASGSYV